MNAEIIRGMLLGLAVGDALGVPVEFFERETLKDRPVTEMRGFGTWKQPAGSWSDDTSMTIATMDSIFRRKGIDYDDISRNFLRWYENSEFTANGTRFDIGNTTRAALVRYSRGILPAVKCGATDDNTNGNGSLMRILPVIVWLFAKNGKISADELEIVHDMSALTHAHPISKISCGIYALVAGYLLAGKQISDAFALGIADAKDFYAQNDDFSHFSRLCSENFGSLREKSIFSGGFVVETLESSLWCLLNTKNFKNLALKAVNLGGDTDTTGAVACGLGGIVYGAENIPENWLEQLKRRDYLEKIAENFASVC